MQIPCDKRHHVHFLKDKAGLLAEIKQTYTKCRIELIKNTEQFELSGPKSVVEAAKAHIEQVISKMVSILGIGWKFTNILKKVNGNDQMCHFNRNRKCAKQ